MSKGRQQAKLCIGDRSQIGVPKALPGKSPRVNLYDSGRRHRSNGKGRGPNESRPSQYRPKK